MTYTEAKAYWDEMFPVHGTAHSDAMTRLVEDISDEIALDDNEVRQSIQVQARIMLVALMVMRDRSEQYGSRSWLMIGWKGHLLRMWDKTVRLMNGHWWGTADADEKPFDNAVDMINHAAFFARAYMLGKPMGELPSD